MALICNICGSTEFSDFGVKPRANARCQGCGSLERHRALRHVLGIEGRLSDRKGVDRCLQLAPEKVTHDYLAAAYGAGYLPADLSPAMYPYAKCLKLRLPEGFEIFPEGYFQLIVHNHVLEHVPGSYRAHIDEFHRLLQVGGAMAFTIPETGISKGVRETVEGGERLPSDEDRLREHGQGDHVRTFGLDLLDHLAARFSVSKPYCFDDDAMLREIRSMRNARGRVFWCVK
jgi:SAM-dependent methyltransferase